MKETVIISLGGSIIVQDRINNDFLISFKKKILSSDKRFIIVVGGGKTCRIYQDAAKAVSTVSAEDLDWIGIAATSLNAHMLRSVFGNAAYEQIVTNPTKKISTPKKIIIVAGWKPGHSTDYGAVCLAKTYGAKTIINMTNVDYLYDKDPKNKGAKKIERADWKTLQTLVGTEWQPGLNRPFDPIATTLAAELELKLIIIGHDLHNLGNILVGKAFNGTIIQ